MSLATSLALLAAVFRARPPAEPDPIAARERARIMARCAELESENARLRRDLAQTQMLLAEAQRLAAAEERSRYVELGSAGPAMLLGSQNLTLDAEIWRNCVPS